MKIIFFSQDGHIQQLANSLSGDVAVVDNQEEVLELLDDVNEEDQCLLFLDFDNDKKKMEKFNKTITPDDWIIRIVISGEMKLKEFRKHQKGKTGAHGYVLKPLTGKVFKTILNDLEISDIIQEQALYEEGTALPSLPKEVSSVEGVDSIPDDFAEDSEVFEAKEFGMNTQVRNLVDLHSVKGDRPPFEGELNERIQDKFDQVFGPYDDEDQFAGEADSGFMASSSSNEGGLSLREETNESIALDLGDDSGDIGGLEISEDEEEIDLGGEDEEEIDLSGDGEEEIDLTANDDDDIDLDGDEEEIDLSSSEDDDIDLDGEEDEIDLTGGDDDEINLDGDEEEIDLLADAEDSNDFESELDDLTANRELPSPEELSEFDEETGDMELPGNMNLSDETGESEVNAADSDLETSSSEEMSMSDDNDELLEFDENEEVEGGELSFSTEPESEAPSQKSDDEEGGLDFDLGGMDDDGELETGASSTQEDSGDLDDGGFDLGGGDDDEFSLETGAVAADEGGVDSATEEEGGMDFDLGGEDDDFVLEAGAESEEASTSSTSGDEGGVEVDLGGDDEFDLGDDAVLEASSEEVDLSGGIAGDIDEDSNDEELSFDENESDDDEELDFGDEEDSDAVIDAAVSAASDFDEEELDFGDEEDEELEKTQAVNVADIGELNAGADSEELDDEELDFGADLDEDGTDDIDPISDVDLDEDFDGDDAQFDADEELLADDIGEDTNPTVVMTEEITRDIEAMGSDPGITNEFRPGAMEEDLEEDFETEDEDIFGDDSEEEVIEESFDDVAGPTDDDFDEPTPTPPPAKKAPRPEEGTLNITRQEDRHPPVFNEGEAVRLQATIRQLREEREELLKEIQDMKKETKLLEQDNLGLKAELDEAKIEISIMKKRHGTEMDEMKYRLRISDEKKLYSEEKARKLQKEFDRLQSKVRMDFNHIKQREKELESQLELVKMDSESQVQSRDKKILELKRKIDQLEFNMENIVIREQKSRDDKVRLEERLERIMKTLRGSIEVLEDDIDFESGDKRGRE